MPLSKPVTKQKLLLPSQHLFHQLPKAKKREVLQRLSVDNLITYLEYIVYGDSLQTKDNLVTLEQIVEEDCKFNSSGSNDSFVTEWIHKNASIARQTELQGKYSKEIQFHVKGEEKPQEALKRSGDFNDLTNNYSNTFGKMSVNNVDTAFASNFGGSMSRASENHYRFKNSWDVTPNASSGQWKSSMQKENVVPFSQANAISLSNNWNGSLFDNKNHMKESIGELFGFGSVNDDKSRIAQQHPRFPFTSLFLQNNPNKARIEDLGNVLANAGPFGSFNTFASQFDQYSTMYDPLEFGNQTRTSLFGNQTNGFTFPQMESINLEVKDSKLFESFNLPHPTTFNQLPNDSRTKILSTLPANVKNKYELFCWANQNNLERRRLGADLAG